METLALLGSASGLGLGSGLRLYSTVLAVGLGIEFGLIDPSPHMQRLEILAHPYVLSGAGFLFVIEFIADKIPWVDTLWDSIHTFVRPVGAGLIGAGAVSDLGPAATTLAVLLCGGVGLAGHASKAGTRVLVNHSPEPLTNVGLSLFEDGFVLGLVFLTIQYPIAALVIVVIVLLGCLYLLPKLFGLMKEVFQRLQSFLTSET